MNVSFNHEVNKLFWSAHERKYNAKNRTYYLNLSSFHNHKHVISKNTHSVSIKSFPIFLQMEVILHF